MTSHLSLSTCVDNKPWTTELHFVYDDALDIYFCSAEFRRHSKEIANNPNVSGNIVKQHPLGEYPHAIYFEGVARKLSFENYDEVYDIFAKQLHHNEAYRDAIKTHEKDCYKITVSDWYAFGKFGQPTGEKYHVPWNKDGV